MASLRPIFAFFCAVVVQTLIAPLFVLSRLLLGRRFTAERLGAASASLLLALFGVKVIRRLPTPMPERRVVYVSNHSSGTDVLVLLALGLPRTRYFMKRGAWIFPPVGVMAACVGTYFTVPQTQTAARHRLFARACQDLQENGDAVYLSPEGTRVTSGGVGPFNKGAFHLAAALQVPMVPLYLQIPTQSNTGKSWLIRRTEVVVHQLPDIPTSTWTPETAREHADEVRAIYQDFERSLR